MIKINYDEFKKLEGYETAEYFGSSDDGMSDCYSITIDDEVILYDVFNDFSGLINVELDFFELDDIMVEKGYYSIMNDGVIEEVIRDKNVHYLSVINNTSYISIDFEIIILANTEVEGLGSTEIRIKNVELIK